MFTLDLPLLLDFTICMQATLKGSWVRLPPTTRRTSSLPFSWSLQIVSFDLSLAFPFCLLFDGSSHRSFIGFLCCLILTCQFQVPKKENLPILIRTCEGLQLSDFHEETWVFKKGKGVDERLPTLPPWWVPYTLWMHSN
jgi:hypothetical protein